MKVSKSQASDNRNAIRTAASAQIRGHGLDQTSVADVARAAGLTHGALYSHFQSKDALTAEAMRCAFADCLREFTGLPAAEFLQRYLSTEHRDNPEVGCPTAALVSEVGRQSAELKAVFRSGVDRFIALAGESLEAVGAEHGYERAVLMFAAMVGGLALSRAIRDVDASGSADILRAVNNQLRLLMKTDQAAPSHGI
jgi:TetR/AcrR family transcriptional repressor of nem operon